MAESRLDDIRQARQRVRQELLNRGIPPYPADGHKTHTNALARQTPDGTSVQIAGRIRSIRGHGKIRFLDLVDESGKIQVVAKADVTANYELVNDCQTSDFIRVTGEHFTTNANEPSVLAQQVEILTKAIRPLPDSWFGLTDEEERYRRRYVDLNLNEAVRTLFRQRAIILQSARRTLDEAGFLEVETPTLQPLYGGANARPFVTHINAWDMDLYLKISDELYLKRLIIGGFDKVYEIDHDFRNEGVDRTHNPEFTMLECYAAYWDYTDIMTLTELICQNAALAVHGTTRLTYQGTTIELGGSWRRLPMKDGIREFLQIDVDRLSDEQLQAEIANRNLKYEGQWQRGLGIAKLFEAVEPKLIQPTFVTDMPRETTSLCKPHRQNPDLIERFEPYVCGWELGNAYSELNDPVLQKDFWEAERQEDPEKHPLDVDFIEALEYGMPPTGGLGLGLDRLVMLLTNQTKLRDVIFFPTMK